MYFIVSTYIIFYIRNILTYVIYISCYTIDALRTACTYYTRTIRVGVHAHVKYEIEIDIIWITRHRCRSVQHEVMVYTSISSILWHCVSFMCTEDIQFILRVLMCTRSYCVYTYTVKCWSKFDIRIRPLDPNAITKATSDR